MNVRKSHSAQWQIFVISGVIILLGTLIYANTFHVPFIFDDIHNIKENSLIRLTTITPGKILQLKNSPCPHRLIANFSFALNYFFHDYNVFGYHLINLIIHLITGLLVFLTARQTLRLTGTDDRFIPALAAVLWLVNPVHTQSVTYIVQRMTAMATMFYLLALFLYIKARLMQHDLPKKKAAHILLFAGCALAGLLGLGSKEIAATLPLFLFIYEWFFFQDLNGQWVKQRLLWIGIACLAFLAIAAVYLGTSPVEKILKGYGHRDFTLGQRLLTEPRIILYYLSLLVFPHPDRLNLNYDISVSTSLIDPATTLLSILTLSGLFVVTMVAAPKNRLLAFAILWFLGNLVIESSFLSLELIFEHRTYLPSIFIIIVLTTALLTSSRIRNTGITALCVTIVVFCYWTYQRNQVWADKVSLWKNCSDKAPGSPRPYINMASALMESGDMARAKTLFQKALQLDPSNDAAHKEYGLLLLEEGFTDQAIDHFRKSIVLNPRNIAAYNNLGYALLRKNQTPKAISALEKARHLNPYIPEVHYNLAKAYLQNDHTTTTFDTAEKAFQEAISLDPLYYKAFNDLGALYLLTGQTDKAVHVLNEAIRINPEYAPAHKNMALTLNRQGNASQALHHILEACRIAPNIPGFHITAGDMLMTQGKTEDAQHHYSKALSLAGGSPRQILRIGNHYAGAGLYSQAVQAYQKLAALMPDNPAVFYNLACLYAKQKNPEQTIAYLEKAINNGYDDVDHLKTDKDLEIIRNTEFYKNILHKLQGRK
ncbi:MAG: tetratricopeptide repeat protein [Thermodesulfobacteriota bacterium]|nr:tetratricopeptide repeat protein [Thermodesulfobacteriota bacterium]